MTYDDSTYPPADPALDHLYGPPQQLGPRATPEPIPLYPLVTVPPQVTINAHGFIPVDYSRDDAEAGKAWPVLDPIAFNGLPGRIVRAIEPHSEADPVAMLFTLYAMAGAVIGRGPHMEVGEAQHGARIWPLIIGDTFAGGKGTSKDDTKGILLGAYPDFACRIMGGLTSGAGLINQVRDGQGDDAEDPNFDEGAPDKRLLAIETEFASVLAQGKRETENLPQIMRAAWDGDRLSTLTVKPRVATGAHIVVIGHITPTELRAKLTKSEVAGGTMNRFLPVLSRRSKLLPNPSRLPQQIRTELTDELRTVLDKAASVGRIQRSQAAEPRWAQVYAQLNTNRMGDAHIAPYISRCAPQTIRLSVLTALLDGAEVITEHHVTVAEAMWNYVEASARYVFSGPSPDLVDLMAFVDAAEGAWVSRTEIVNVCFKRKKTAKEVAVLLNQLITISDYEGVKEATAGRPRELFRRKKGKKG